MLQVTSGRFYRLNIWKCVAYPPVFVGHGCCSSSTHVLSFHVDVILWPQPHQGKCCYLYGEGCLVMFLMMCLAMHFLILAMRLYIGQSTTSMAYVMLWWIGNGGPWCKQDESQDESLSLVCIPLTIVCFELYCTVPNIQAVNKLFNQSVNKLDGLPCI